MSAWNRLEHIFYDAISRCTSRARLRQFSQNHILGRLRSWLVVGEVHRPDDDDDDDDFPELTWPLEDSVDQRNRGRLSLHRGHKNNLPFGRSQVLLATSRMTCPEGATLLRKPGVSRHPTTTLVTPGRPAGDSPLDTSARGVPGAVASQSSQYDPKRPT